MAPTVDPSGVEEVATARDRLLEGRPIFLVLTSRPPAHVAPHAPHAVPDGADRPSQSTQRSAFHGPFPGCHFTFSGGSRARRAHAPNSARVPSPCRLQWSA